MHKKLLFGLALFGLLSVLLAACAIRDTAVSGPTVPMGNAAFIQTSITIHKGDPLVLTNPSTVAHEIKNGSWVNGAQKPATESGAPQVSFTSNAGDSMAVGPFNTAGTFHLYCTIHQGMNLTVTVQ